MAFSSSNPVIFDADSASRTPPELSDLDSVLFDDLDVEDSDTSSSEPASKRRKLRALSTWSYARAPRDDEDLKNQQGRRYFYCAQCPYWRNVITTNIRAHLISKHGIFVKEQESVIKQATKQRIEGLFQKQGELEAQKLKERKERILRECVKIDIVREALAQLIVVRNLPFEAVTWPELRALLLSVNYTCEDALVDSDSTVPKLIEDSFMLDKVVLKRKLHTSLSWIHFSIDAWSSPNRKTFVAICAHFVDDTSMLRKALLALPFLPGKHGGDEQVEVLWQVLQDYEILHKIGYCVGDNHGSNDKLLRRLSTRLREAGIEARFDAKQHRIRCHGHVLNIAAQAFFFSEDKEAVDAAFLEAKAKLEQDSELDEDQIEEILAKRFKKGKASKFTYRSIGPPGKIHNIVVHIRSSNAHYNHFLAIALRAIPMDNDTRWNSWYKMILVALELRAAITKYQEEYVDEFDEEDIINATDWKALDNAREFLQPFQRVIKETEGDKATLDKVLYTMDFMIEHFKMSLVKYAANSKLCDCIRTSWHAFDKYYLKTDQVTAYGAALLLAPHRRKAYITRNWKASWRKPVIDAARKLWMTYYKDKFKAEATAGKASELGKEPDAYDLWDKKQSVLNLIEDEFDHFINASPVNLPQGTTALDWWLNPSNRTTYPCLYRMAVDILSIPPMSAEPERIFSGARRTISWQRMKLGPVNIERIECLKSWIRTGLVAGWRKELLVECNTPIGRQEGYQEGLEDFIEKSLCQD